MELLNDFLSWVWARHHNELSWYVRPLFLLPFCLFAYRRSVWGIVVTLLVFPTSLFWFPAPENPSARVEGYLAWERQFLLEGSLVARVALVLLVVAFFVALATAFWKRSWLWGLAVINAGTLLKVIWSVAFGGVAGWASLAPSIFTLAITDAALLLAMRFLRRRRERREGSRKGEAGVSSKTGQKMVRRGWLRSGLLLVAATTLGGGLWALPFPRSFYGNFPFPGWD